jgi:hypothetical protein
MFGVAATAVCSLAPFFTGRGRGEGLSPRVRFVERLPQADTLRVNLIFPSINVNWFILSVADDL